MGMGWKCVLWLPKWPDTAWWGYGRLRSEQDPVGPFWPPFRPFPPCPLILSEVYVHVSCWRFIATLWLVPCGQEWSTSAPRSLQQPTMPFPHFAFKNALQFWFGEFNKIWGHEPLIPLHGHVINFSLLRIPTFWFVWPHCTLGTRAWANRNARLTSSGDLGIVQK